MRRRAYVPEAPGRLEGRALLSGGPVPLSGLRFDTVVNRTRADFEQYATGRDLSLLRSQLVRIIPMVPFGRVDGLGGTVNGILDRMQADLAAGVPRAVTAAYQDVVAALRADAEARIEDGSVVVVR